MELSSFYNPATAYTSPYRFTTGEKKRKILPSHPLLPVLLSHGVSRCAAPATALYAGPAASPRVAVPGAERQSSVPPPSAGAAGLIRAVAAASDPAAVRWRWLAPCSRHCSPSDPHAAAAGEQLARRAAPPPFPPPSRHFLLAGACGRGRELRASNNCGEEKCSRFLL